MSSLKCTVLFHQSQSAINLGQVCNYMQSVCDNVTKISNLLLLFGNLFPSTRTETHINDLHSSWNLMGLKQKIRNSTSNSDGVAAGWRFDCKMTQVLDSLNWDKIKISPGIFGSGGVA